MGMSMKVLDLRRLSVCLRDLVWMVRSPDLFLVMSATEPPARNSTVFWTAHKESLVKFRFSSREWMTK